MGSLNRLHGKLGYRFLACVFVISGILGFVAIKGYGEILTDAELASKYSSQISPDGLSATYTSCKNDAVTHSCTRCSTDQNWTCHVDGDTQSSGSLIDNLGLNYHHWAYDYQLPQGVSGCSSCSGGAPSSSPGMNLEIERRHRYRDQSYHNSFGPGVFCNYDTQIALSKSTTNIINMFDPRDMTMRSFVDQQSPDPVGLFRDVVTNSIKDLRLLDAQGNLASSIDLAVTAQMTDKVGKVTRFGIIRVGNGAISTVGPNSGSALQFDGVQDYIALGSPANLDFTGSITLSAWVKPNDTTTIQYIVSHVSPGATPAQEVFLRIKNGNYQVGQVSSTNNNASYAIPSGDIGTWVHLTGVYNGTKWLLYRNGVKVANQADTVGAQSISGGQWAIGSRGMGMDRFFNGAIADVQIYNQALADTAVTALATNGTIASGLVSRWKLDQLVNCRTVTDTTGGNTGYVGNATLAGRLVQIQDRNGYGVNLTYKTFTEAQLDEAPDRQWQINTVTDTYGRQATFSYLPQQVSANWVVSQISVADGNNTRTTQYTYGDGVNLTAVAHPDGTTSTFAYGTDAATQTTTIAFDDASADGTHRRKTAYFGNNFVATGNVAQQLFSQSSLLIRMLKNGAGELSYANFPSDGTNAIAVYEGGGSLKQVTASGAQFYQSWALADPSQGGSGVQGTLEPTYTQAGPGGDLHTNARRGTLPWGWDKTGRRYDFLYDADSNTTQKTYSDGTTEQWAYNGFAQVTRHVDRLNRVTRYTYDANGNKLTEETGILYNPSTQQDVNQPEYAVSKWVYYGANEAVNGVTQPAFFLKAKIDPNSNRTQYVYNAQKLLAQVQEPDDTGTGFHTAQSFTYDSVGRLATSTDATGRTANFTYDVCNRQIRTTYADQSTEETLYGTGADANLPIARKDRNGVVSIIRYDANGRAIETVAAAAKVDAASGTILTGFSVPTAGQYLPEASVTADTYLNGTNEVASEMNNGSSTTYAYDYRLRQVSTTIQPRLGETLTSTKTYVNNELFATTDPFGNSQYYAYRDSDGTLIRTVQGTRPGLSLADSTAVTSLQRDLSANAKSLVTDTILNTAGDTIGTTDARGISSTITLDSRGRQTQIVQAVGTQVATTAQMIYDAAGNVLEIRNPRYFDSKDTQGFNKANEKYTYTRRNLKATHTVAAGDAAYPTGSQVSESWAYNLDRTVSSHTDFRGNAWQTLWSACCANRVTGQIDPLGTGTTRDYDYAGNVTHTQTLHDTTVFHQVTTRYDGRHRPIAQTVWLVPQTNVDPNHAPIAGGGLSGDPAAQSNGSTIGMTTRYIYDDNLTDGQGLDSSSGVSVSAVKGSGTYSVSLSALLAKLSSDAGVTFGPGSVGSAVVTINPEDEISATITDGNGRTVATGLLKHDGTLMTWQTAQYDNVVSITNFGQGVETAQIDALQNTTKRDTDGAGRMIRSVDAKGYVSNYTYDALSNKLSVRDPNKIGWDATYDELGRQVTIADTQEQAEGKQQIAAYNAAGQAIRTTDAKGQNATTIYDALGRTVSATDRLGGVTTWKYDQNGNLLALCDADNQAAQQPTVYTYDTRNQQLSMAYPDHVANSSVGGTGYDMQTFTYDLAGQPAVFTDQKGDNITHTFDLAGRLVRRDYRNAGKTGIADSDSLAYDDAGRLISANSGRYNNTVALAYDKIGRLNTESLTVNFGTATTYSTGITYDAANNRTAITYPDGTVINRAYDPRHLLTKISNGSTALATFSYDNAGRRVSRVLGDTPATTTTWSYGRQDNLVTGIDTPNVTSFAYTYDANKNKTAETITGVMAPYGFAVPSNGYDAEDRLVGWNRTDNKLNQSWNLSLVGDWQTFTENGTVQTRTHDAVHALTKAGAILSYGPKGNLGTDKTKSPTHSYSWDADNRLSGADINNDGTNELQFTYDALGRRVSKTVSGATTVYVSSSQQEIAEYTANAAPAMPQCKYVYADYIDEPLAMFNISGGVSTTYYYHQNSLYSVVAITDQSGTAIERYAYSANGKPIFLNASNQPLAQQQSAIGNPYLYTARRLDSETGLYYYRARYYDPNLGRFISRDPKGYEGGINLYEYVYDSPLQMLDPLGLAGSSDPTELSCSGINRTPISYGQSHSFNWGVFFVQWQASISGAMSGKKCKVCCPDGRKVEDEEINVTFSGQVTGGAGIGHGFDPQKSHGGFHIYGYVGIKFELQGSISGSGGGKTNRCEGVDSPHFKACGTVSVGGALSGGGNVSVAVGKWFNFDAAAEVFGSATATKEICYDCTGADGCHWTSSPWKKQPIQVGYRVCFGPCFTGTLNLSRSSTPWW